MAGESGNNGNNNNNDNNNNQPTNKHPNGTNGANNSSNGFRPLYTERPEPPPSYHTYPKPSEIPRHMSPPPSYRTAVRSSPGQNGQSSQSDRPRQQPDGGYGGSTSVPRSEPIDIPKKQDWDRDRDRDRDGN